MKEYLLFFNELKVIFFSILRFTAARMQYLPWCHDQSNKLNNILRNYLGM